MVYVQNFYNPVQKESCIFGDVSIFDSSMMNFPFKLLICPVLSCNRKISLLIWIYLRWNRGMVSHPPRRKYIERSWALVPSTPSWGITEKTIEMRRSNKLSLFMYVMSLTCNFGDFDEYMVLSLTRWTLSAIDNASYLYFAVANLGCVSGGSINLDIFWCSALSDLYEGQILFVGKYLQKVKIMASHNFWIWRSVSPFRVMNGICLVNCDAWGYFLVTWEVSIWWYHSKIGHKRKDLFLIAS